jgi:hypothetical protein
MGGIPCRESLAFLFPEPLTTCIAASRAANMFLMHGCHVHTCMGATYTLAHLLNFGANPNSITVWLIQGLLVEANE